MTQTVDQRDGTTLRWRIAVVGCGSIGQRHIRNLKALGIENVIAIDPEEARRLDVAGRMDVETGISLDDAWEWLPDVVFVCTPTSLHIQPALEAARRGCHLFIEKPLSHDLSRVATLLDLVESQDLVTLVGCNLRFHPGLCRVKSLLDSAAVGTVTSIRAEVGQYLPDWRPNLDYRTSYSARADLGGGIILDAIHEIDYVRWLMGEIDEVACFSGQFSHLDIDTEDTAAIILQFNSGVIGELHLDYVQRSYSRSCTIIGDEGTIHWDYKEGVRYYSAVSGQWECVAMYQDWASDDMYVRQIDHFIQCLDRKEVSTLDVFEAARVLEVALAAKRASSTHEIQKLGRRTIRGSS